jgi:hypothetical protein
MLCFERPGCFFRIIIKMNGIYLVLFDMNNNRIFGPYLAAIHRILTLTCVPPKWCCCCFRCEGGGGGLTLLDVSDIALPTVMPDASPSNFFFFFCIDRCAQGQARQASSAQMDT